MRTGNFQTGVARLTSQAGLLWTVDTRVQGVEGGGWGVVSPLFPIILPSEHMVTQDSLPPHL